jgi:hypothetical protein
MWRPGWVRSVLLPGAKSPARPAAVRDRLAVLLALVTIVCLGLVFFFSKGTSFLMPGPLSSAHGGIETCNTCHTKSGSGKMSWTHGLVTGDPRADSKACLNCHKMPDTAFNAHGAPVDVLEKSTARLTKIADETPQPQSALAQSVGFPTHDLVAGGLYCATCHQEHQGVNFKLNTITNEQCRSCHVVKFDSFDGNHPKFGNYPFKKRTQIVYDHAGHFNKHYPEVAKKDPAKRIPATCSTCHNSSKDKRIMAVAPFEQTCATCHLDQITGKERVSGPKGIAFLTLPGLDLQSLKKKNASMGEWPDASDAALSPFMKVMISRNERGRALLKTVDRLNLQDLSNASDEQITAVTNLVWEIKALFHAIILGKASDVLGDLNITGAKLSPDLVTDLTASIPRDVLISAQQQWLPNLATEMANRKVTGDQAGSVWTTVTTSANAPGSSATATPSDTGPRQTAPGGSSQADDRVDDPESKDARDAAPGDSPKADDREAAITAKRDPQPCLVRVLGQCLMFKGKEAEAQAAQPLGATGQTDAANPKPASGTAKSSANKLPGAMRAGLADLAQAAEPEAAGRKTDAAGAKQDSGKKTPSAGEQPRAKAADQSDDLLFPTPEELREIKAQTKGGGKVAQPDEAAGKADTPDAAAKADAAVSLPVSAAPVISIESNVDSESWAEYGGWYRQDYAIFYRPTGHKDKFIYTWLFLTGPQSPRGDASPAAAVFDVLTSKDAQGSCTKCHSVDDLQGKGRIVNFSQPSAASKQGHFTSFIHEPHFGSLEDRGCLSCHAIEKDRAYLKSYEQGNAQSFVSNFGAVKKDLCQSCHNRSMARQDCLTCHKYHVNGVITPIMSTKLPTL